MRILLTGTRGYRPGFIGNNFLRMYKDKYDIVEWEGNIADFRHYDASYFKDFDMVVHLAAMAGVRRSHQDPQLYWDTNVNASKHIFRITQANVPVLYASSSSIYEWWLSPYATTKYAMECIAPKNTLGLRFHTVYGPNSRSDMLYDMLLNKDVEYLTNHTRDWTHVDDVCRAIEVCIENWENIKWNMAIDVGNGAPVSVKDLAEHLWPHHNLRIKDVTGEREHTLADPTVLKRFGWEPQHHVLDPIEHD